MCTDGWMSAAKYRFAENASRLGRPLENDVDKVKALIAENHTEKRVSKFANRLYLSDSNERPIMIRKYFVDVCISTEVLP